MLNLKVLFYLEKYQIQTFKASDTLLLTIKLWTLNNGELLVREIHMRVG